MNPLDGSILLTARLADRAQEPPYGYADKRAAIVCLNGTTGGTLWISVTGLFNPLNADSAKVSQLLLHPSGDIFFWQTTNGTVHLIRMDIRGKVMFNISGSNGVEFTSADEMTYIADDDSIWTNVHQVRPLRNSAAHFEKGVSTNSLQT